MLELLRVFSIIAAIGATGWLVGVFLLRLVWASLATFTIVTLLLAGQGQQDARAPLGLGAFTVVFWFAWQLLHRARYGWWRSWRSRRAESMFGRHAGRDRLGVERGKGARGGGGA